MENSRGRWQVSMLIDNLLSPILTDWILIEYQVERWKTQNSSYKCRGRIKEDTGGLRGTWLAAVFMPHNHILKNLKEEFVSRFFETW